MNFAHLLVTAAATPSPIPTDKVPDASKVSPGLPGFVMIFLLAVAVIILVTSMNKRIRRVRMRAEEQELREMVDAGRGSGDEPDAGDEPEDESDPDEGSDPDDESGGRQTPQ